MSRRRSACVRFQAGVEGLEERRLLSFADGNGAVVTSLTAPTNRTIVITFDGPLNASQAQNPGYFAVNGLSSASPELITQPGKAIRVVAANYNPSTHQVGLILAQPLKPSTFYRVFINGTPGSGLTDATGTTIDGDNDDTPAGNFYGLVAYGNRIAFRDMSGNQAQVRISGGGQVDLWRELNGNVDQLSVVGAVAGQSTLTGVVHATKGSNGLVVIPSYQGLTGVNNLLPPTFVSQAPPVNSPTPVVANAANPPYSLAITQVPMPSVPGIQSAVYVQAGGKWLVFGGRTNGLHNFDPSGLVSFPPIYQNNNIYVIDPSTGQTWSESWNATGLSQAVTRALASTNQESFQQGNRLYTIGGYSFDPSSSQFTTYDAVSSLNVKGLINSVVFGGSPLSQSRRIGLRQGYDSRMQVTGGDLTTLGGKFYMMFGQDFQGGYNGATASISQVYTDEIRSFRIVNKGANSLAIANYQAQRDPVNFRRRDGNLAVPSILPNGRQAITTLGGVFTPQGSVFRQPITVGPNGFGVVNQNYLQYFTQYNSAKTELFDPRLKTMSTILFGGISLYNYNFSTGTLSSDPEIPFVNDVTSLVQSKNGSIQEYIMPSQLPGRYGAESAFFASSGLPTYANGVINFARLPRVATLGYIYGGVFSTVGNTSNPATQTTASNQVFKVTLVKN